MDQNPTETSVQRPRQDTSGDVKVPMTQDAMTKISQCFWSMYIFIEYCTMVSTQLGPETRRETVLCGSSPTIGQIGLDDTIETEH